MKSHYWHFQKSAPTWTEHVPASPQNVIESFIETGYNSVIIQDVLIIQSDIFRNGTYVTLRSTRVWLTQTVLGWKIITTGSIHGGNLWILIVGGKIKSGYYFAEILNIRVFHVQKGEMRVKILKGALSNPSQTEYIKLWVQNYFWGI